MKLKNKILSVIMLVLFGIPGIFAEGLHIMLPFGIGMIYHENTSNGSSQNNVPFPQPFQYNPNCPICQFCSISVTSTFSIVFTILVIVIAAVELQTYCSPILSFYKTVLKRGPPLFTAF